MNENNFAFSFPEIVNHWFLDIRSKLGNEKIVLGIDAKSHLTIHFGTKSKVLDVHLTDETKSIDEKHRTLIRISHADGISMAEEIGNVYRSYFTEFPMERINLGKLNKHNCILSPLGGTPNLTATLIKQKRNKIKFQKEISIDDFNQLYIFPTEGVEYSQSKSFMVHKYTKSTINFKGLVIFPKNAITRKPYFLSKSVLNKIKMSEFEVLVKFVRNKNIEIEPTLLQKMEKVLKSRYPKIN